MAFYLLNMSHRPCSDRPCPGSSRGYTASCSQQTPKGIKLQGQPWEKKQRSSRPGHVGRGLTLTLSHPLITEALSSQTLHRSQVVLQREASGSEKEGMCLTPHRKRGPTASKMTLLLLGPSLCQSPLPVSLLCHCPAPGHSGSHSL